MKTIKQAAEEYANTKAKVVVSGTEINNTIDDLNLYSQTDFTAGVKFAQEWISVEDEMPLESVDEILIKDDESTLVAVYRFGKFNTGFSFEFNPTHWRPIERK
jgi:hypothetical protein